MGIANTRNFCASLCNFLFICLLYFFLQLTSTNFWISSLITCVHCLNWLKRASERKRERVKEMKRMKKSVLKWSEENKKRIWDAEPRTIEWERKQTIKIEWGSKKKVNESKIPRAEKENRWCWLKRDDWNLNFLPAGHLFVLVFFKPNAKWPSIDTLSAHTHTVHSVQCSGKWPEKIGTYVDKKRRAWPTGKYSKEWWAFGEMMSIKWKESNQIKMAKSKCGFDKWNKWNTHTKKKCQKWILSINTRD